MDFQVGCPQCGKTYNVNDGYVGRRVVCKACKHSFTVLANQGFELEDEAPKQNTISKPSPHIEQEKLVKRPSSVLSGMKFVLGGCLTLVVIGVIGIVLLGKGCEHVVKEADKQMAQGKVERQKNAEALPLSDIKLVNMVDDFQLGSKTTKIQQEDIFNNNYRGKKVRWEITVYDITDFLGSLQIQSKDDLRVIARLNQSEKSKAIKYKEGDKVLVEGVISDYSSIIGSITLENASIVTSGKLTKKEEKQTTPIGTNQEPEVEEASSKPKTSPLSDLTPTKENNAIQLEKIARATQKFMLAAEKMGQQDQITAKSLIGQWRNNTPWEEIEKSALESRNKGELSEETLSAYHDWKKVVMKAKTQIIADATPRTPEPSAPLPTNAPATSKQDIIDEATKQFLSKAKNMGGNNEVYFAKLLISMKAEAGWAVADGQALEYLGGNSITQETYDAYREWRKAILENQ